MIRAIILESNIEDKLWLELMLVITYIKNSRLTKVLANNLSPHKAHLYKNLDLLHLQILGSTIYIFLYEEEQTKKSEKWASQALREILIDFNRYIIYKIYIKDQNKLIQVKNL